MCFVGVSEVVTIRAGALICLTFPTGQFTLLVESDVSFLGHITVQSKDKPI